MTYDIIIIGAGPGGYETALKAAHEGLKVALVEKGEMGGTCLNRGCIPTKSFCHMAELLHAARQSCELGLGVSAPTSIQDLTPIVDYKEKVVSGLRSGIEALMKHPNITVYTRQAVTVNQGNVTLEDGQTLEASNIIIATGAREKLLPIPGVDLPGVVTSTEMLNLTTLPARLCVIGGGVVGMEFASIFNTLGSEVTVVEYAPEILPRFDQDMAKRLRTGLKRAGVNFNLGAAVCEIQRCEEENALQVNFTQKGKACQVTADLVLMSVGRAPNVEGLQLPPEEVASTPRGITVDQHMQTTTPGIYAIGDCNGLSGLAHVATFQGIVALDHILGRPTSVDLNLVPSAVFTYPELATVGQTEQECKDAGLEYSVQKCYYRQNGKAVSMGEGDGYAKFLWSTDDTLLGAHIMGAHASDLIHEATILMRTGAKRHLLKNTIHAHPTLSEIILQ